MKGLIVRLALSAFLAFTAAGQPGVGVWTAATGSAYTVAFNYQNGGGSVNLTGSPSYGARIRLAETASQVGKVDEAVHELSQLAVQVKAQGRADDFVRVAERLLFHRPSNFAVARELAAAYIQRSWIRRRRCRCGASWPSCTTPPVG